MERSSLVLSRHLDKWQPEPNTGCYIWLASCAKGYPRVRHEGKDRLVARIVCEEVYGPSELEACHKPPCKNILCINPDHLYWGTRQQNENDKRPDQIPRPYIWKHGDDMYQVVIRGKFVGVFNSVNDAIHARDAFMSQTQ